MNFQVGQRVYWFDEERGTQGIATVEVGTGEVVSVGHRADGYLCVVYLDAEGEQHLCFVHPKKHWVLPDTAEVATVAYGMAVRLMLHFKYKEVGVKLLDGKWLTFPACVTPSALAEGK